MVNIILAVVAGLLSGGILAFILFNITTSRKIANAKSKSEKIITEAETEKKEILLQAKDEAMKEKDSAKRSYDEKSRYLERTEQDLRRRELTIDSRFAEIDKSHKEITSKEKQIEETKQVLRDLRKKQEDSLERIAKMTKDEAKQVLFDLIEKEGKEELVKKIKEVDVYVKENADVAARKVVVTAMQRVAAETAAESTICTVDIPSDEMKGRIIGREGRNIRAIETLTGIDLIIDDTPEAVILSGFDPVRREVARIALEKLIVDGRIHPARIEEMVQKALNS